MDSHPLLQAPSQDTCAYFQRTPDRASAPSPYAATFPPSEPPIIAAFPFPSTPQREEVDPSTSTPKGRRRSEPPIMTGFSFPSTPSSEVDDPLPDLARPAGNALKQGAHSRPFAEYVNGFSALVDAMDQLRAARARIGTPCGRWPDVGHNAGHRSLLPA
ncbi:hypothetical protein STPYR_12385 [uncultured Stenotrophomonas sp.]|uniref:Uncharacterized protein n=1 Tax=uncultured Stenotrophomonas sp. TaxID=165438 RepID=A0A1Y5Q8L7_9GAMM|nr:hypothetical protein STPYR_12385 [uncultured Stenotrophomonas sp.]